MQAPQLSNLIEICLLGSEIKHAKKWTNMASDRLFVHGASKERITIFYCQSFQKMHYVNYICCHLQYSRNEILLRSYKGSV